MTTTRKSFLPKLALFLAPVAAYLILTVGIAYHAGEFMPLHEVAALQSHPEPLLYGRAYRDNYFAFKLVSARLRKPEILVIGSSRSMQFRSELFSLRRDAFYNAGGAVQNVHEIREFLKALGDSGLPKLLILGLDQPWFNARTAEGFSVRRIREQLDEEDGVALSRAMNMGRFVLKDLMNGKLPLRRVIARRDPLYGVPARGVAAITRGGGFRNDGSYQYASILSPPPVKERLAEGRQRLRDDIGHFTRGDSVSEGNLAEVRDLLRYCKERGIHVAGFSPPFAPGIVKQMVAGGRHGYLAESSRLLDSLFRAEGFAYGDFTDPTALGVEDEDMVDGFHGSELVYLKIHLALLDRLPEVFRAAVDVAYLQERARSTRVHRLVAFEAGFPSPSD